MKNIIKSLSMALLAAGFAACEGTGSEDGPIATGKYEFYVDKAEIEADGADAATITLQDPDGKILTEGNTLNYVEIINENTGESLDRGTNIFTAIKNGTYTFKVKYKGKSIDGTVTVTAKNRVKYEKYHRRVVAYDCTNTWCSACAPLAVAFESIDAEWKEHLALLAIHGPYDQRDKWILGNVVISLYTQFDQAEAYPTVFYNLEQVEGGSRTPSEIVEIIQDQLRANPATCGLSLDSEYTVEGENAKITITSGFESSAAGTYDVGFAVLLDNQLSPTGGHLEGDIYDDIAIAITPNYSRMSSDTKFDVQAGGTHTSGTVFELTGTLTDEQKENCRVVAFALRNKSGEIIIDNAAVAKLGTSQEIVYNE